MALRSFDRVKMTATIPASGAGIRRTLRALTELARGAGRATAEQAEALLYATGSREAYPHRLRSWLGAHWLQEPDPYGVELVRAPDSQLHALWRTGVLRGDCDDIAVLGAALALAAHYPARYVAIGTGSVGLADHVYAEIRAPSGAWVDLDILRPPGTRQVPRVWAIVDL